MQSGIGYVISRGRVNEFNPCTSYTATIKLKRQGIKRINFTVIDLKTKLLISAEYKEFRTLRRSKFYHFRAESDEQLFERICFKLFSETHIDFEPRVVEFNTDDSEGGVTQE